MTKTLNFWPRMIITCPSCSTRYPVDASAFPASGRKVRCAKCGHGWHQAAPDDLPRKIDLEDQTEGYRAAYAPAPAFKKSDPAPESFDAAEVDEDIDFAPQPAGPVPDHAPEEQKSDDVDIVFAPTSAASSESAMTGGRLRAHLHNVASLRRGRVLNAAGWTVLLVFVIASLYGVFTYRSQITSFWPASAKFYAATGNPINLRGVEFQNVAYERQNENGLPVLAVKGEVVNISNDMRSLPRLRVSLSDAQNQELYHWTFALPEKNLKPKGSASFTTRLSSPPVEARSIEVRFLMKDEEPPKPVEAAAKSSAGQADPAAPTSH